MKVFRMSLVQIHAVLTLRTTASTVVTEWTRETIWFLGSDEKRTPALFQNPEKKMGPRNQGVELSYLRLRCVGPAAAPAQLSLKNKTGNTCQQTMQNSAARLGEKVDPVTHLAEGQTAPAYATLAADQHGGARVRGSMQGACLGFASLKFAHHSTYNR